jgi:hypothetical protein
MDIGEYHMSQPKRVGFMPTGVWQSGSWLKAMAMVVSLRAV